MRLLLAVLISMIMLPPVFSQECKWIDVTGMVQDTTKTEAFYNLMIVNRANGVGIFGNPNGTFSFNAKEGDQITISVSGYKTTEFTVGNYNCKYKKTIVLEMLSYKSDAVVVHPVKTLDQIKKERQELALKETRTVTGIDAFQSPITALYERFNKIEKSKHLAAQLEHEADINNVLKELLRTYVSYDVVKLDESEFMDFIHFLNIPESFLKTASDYQLILYIKDKLEHYKKLNDYYYQEDKK